MRGPFRAPFGDQEEQTFKLGYEQLAELESLRDAGAVRLLRRLLSDDCKSDDILETIRLGLIGGGMTDVEALRTVRKFIKDDTQNRDEQRQVAAGIISATIFPDEGGEQPEKSQAAKATN